MKSGLGAGFFCFIRGGTDPAQEDVYVWVVQLKDVFRKKHKYIGHVTLVK